MATKEPTLFWFDFETSGVDSRRDRIFQVAGLRTNLQFEPVDEPINIFCKPTTDFLPHPEACLVTGISPQLARDKGLTETDFCRQLQQQMLKQNTCTLGYNSLSFDDEFMRNMLYRNLHDPYAREWQNGNSRWDIIDLVRCAAALRPDGIEWPVHEDGSPSFRLEELTKANGLAHEQAHDALSDVYATIAMAKLIHDKQPKLYDYVFTHRQKNAIFKSLSVVDPKPMVYISAYYPATQGCMSIVLPLAMHPQNSNGIIVYDLQHAPEEFLSLDVAELKKRLFTAAKDMAEGDSKLPVKLIQANKCPVLVPLNTLDKKSQDRYSINIAQCLKHAATLQEATEFKQRLPHLYDSALSELESEGNSSDPEQAIYSGGFFKNEDRARMNRLHLMSPDDLSESMSFDDGRIPELLFRLRARNYPDLLSDEEKQRWTDYRQARLEGKDGSGALSLTEFDKALTEARAKSDLSADQVKLLDQLEAWRREITADLELK